MERKKLISRIFLVAAIIALMALAATVMELPYYKKLKDKHAAAKDKELSEQIGAYQQYLDETAAKMTSTAVDPKVLSDVKSYIFKKTPRIKIYLWMCDSEDNFLFGIPGPVFTRLNRGYDKYRNIIEHSGYFVDRTDFLMKTVQRHEDVSFSEFQRRVPRAPVAVEGQVTTSRELFVEPEDLNDRLRYMASSSSEGLSLSAPVVDENRQVIGDLYMKVEDEGLEESFYDTRRGTLQSLFFDFSHAALAISLLTIWFLLPTWVYIDARERDVKRVLLWVVLALISFGVAFVVYLIVRPEAEQSFNCPDCRGELNGTKAFCPHCGFDLADTFCPQCQYPVKPEWQFCPSCRFDMKEKPQMGQPREEVVRKET